MYRYTNEKGGKIMENNKQKSNDEAKELMKETLNEAIEKLDNIDDVEDITTASPFGIIACCG